MTGVGNRCSTDTFNEGEVNDQTGGVVQIDCGGDEGSKSLDIINSTSQIPNSEVVDDGVEVLRTLAVTQASGVLASADEDLGTSVGSQGTSGSTIDNNNTIGIGSDCSAGGIIVGDDNRESGPSVGLDLRASRLSDAVGQVLGTNANEQISTIELKGEKVVSTGFTH